MFREEEVISVPHSGVYTGAYVQTELDITGSSPSAYGSVHHPPIPLLYQLTQPHPIITSHCSVFVLSRVPAVLAGSKKGISERNGTNLLLKLKK